MNWSTNLTVRSAPMNDPVGPVAAGSGDDAAIAAALVVAANVYAGRRDSFAEGKADTCRDIARKVERFGSFASEKQRDFAVKLIAWSKPRTAAAPAQENGLDVPKLFTVMQKHATMHAGDFKIARRNADSFCWVSFRGLVVGKLQAQRAEVFPRKAQTAGVAVHEVIALLAEFEADPLAAAKRHGKLSGCCCSCGADLTAEASIEAGIGPICAKRFA